MAKKAQASKLEVQNAAKTLLANIRFMGVDNPIRSIVITSSIPNEGKSTVSLNLAQAIATSGKQVLLVECDMRRRSLADDLGMHALSGLYAVLSDQASLESAVVATRQQNMYFLDAEPHIPNPADILASKRFRRLMKRLEEAYDYVVFDTPPVGTFVDAAVLSSLADATILVVRENFTKRQTLADAYEQLKKAEANVIGVVMNCCEMESSDYYYAYYNKDGKRVKKSGRSDSSSDDAPQLNTESWSGNYASSNASTARPASSKSGRTKAATTGVSAGSSANVSGVGSAGSAGSAMPNAANQSASQYSRNSGAYRANGARKNR
ncbi:CpsD/CapB family tyrosine-protein kinase [Adlercreutzia sp. ZJ141]|uniref:CpsD/CapB family tyrosine-protein kinase n=1 Tax=Adlercreutzia sp. ZJ141 TaxID=2709406 RepID=UPI0013ED79EB|nr:CpsD/CapB family tyrosine-protein kinase [Adlercreutzia sp. ZJ141]